MNVVRESRRFLCAIAEQDYLDIDQSFEEGRPALLWLHPSDHSPTGSVGLTRADVEHLITHLECALAGPLGRLVHEISKDKPTNE